MLQIIILLMNLLISSIGQAQSFEGKITYRVEIKNADSNKIPDSVFNIMYEGAPTVTYTYYYKDNRYKSVSDGEIKTVQIYDPSENRIYSYTEGTEVAFWSEWNKQTTIEKVDKAETILGIECSTIIMRTNNSETTLYYPLNYKIDILKLKEANAWEKYLKVAGTAPLKYIISGGGAVHVTVLTATAVTEEKLDDDFFNLPKFKQILKSPF